MKPVDPILMSRIREIPLRGALEFYGVTFNGHSFALCPFHDEDTPSFLCREGDARWKCFGCGESGDLIDFVRKRRGLSFPQAVASVCRDWRLSDSRPTFAEMRADDEAKIRRMHRKRALRRAEDEYLDALSDWLTCVEKLRLAEGCDPMGRFVSRLRWDEIKARFALEQAEAVRAILSQKEGETNDCMGNH